ncbi:MAG: chorismate mutase [Gammaproteobacteria bacterium]|nr:chorismate mutase [Gammaproteobacteria bacterium]
MSEEQLKKLRMQIAAIDQELIELIAKRRGLSRQVAQLKYDNSLQIRDLNQERNLLFKLLNQAEELGIEKETTKQIFHNIIADSVKTQYQYFINPKAAEHQKSTVAVLGNRFSYSAIACKQHFNHKGAQLDLHYCQNFNAVIDSLREKSADFAIVPIENTNSGDINEIYELLINNQLFIVGEEKLKVNHCLIANPNSKLAQIRQVYAHPQAAQQTSAFFDANNKISLHYSSSTSEALDRLLQDSCDVTTAAIASSYAANELNLNILKENINNQQANYTRFLILSRQTLTIPPQVATKTSVLFQAKNEFGSLSKCLQLFQQHQININKIVSRPIYAQPWKELFYLEFEGNVQDQSVKDLLFKLESESSQLRILGSYPASISEVK